VSIKATPLFAVYDGVNLDGLVFRAVHACPPNVDDFRSHESLGLPYPRARFVRATGISVFRTRTALDRVRRRFGLGPCTAALDLATHVVAWTEAGRPDHLTVWADPAVLLERVVQCDDAQ
jgi:hypothetical protein